MLNAVENYPRPYYFRDDYLQGHALRGVLTSSAGHRLIGLNEDLIRGLHKATAFETGRAWTVVMYTCGRRWGERLIKRWQSEWQHFYDADPDQADYPTFEIWFKTCFTYHGWGELEIDFDEENEGLIHFNVKHCILAKLLKDLEDDHVCEIFAGLFAAVTSWLSGRTLDAIQIDCEKSGASVCRFAVALPDRIERAREARMSGGDRADVLNALNQ